MYLYELICSHIDTAKYKNKTLHREIAHSATDSYYQPQTLSSLAAAAGGGGGQLDITTVITTLSSSVIL